MWLKILLQTLFPILAAYLNGLLSAAQAHVDAGNHDLAHQVLSDGIKAVTAGLDVITKDILGPVATPGGGQGAPIK